MSRKIQITEGDIRYMVKKALLEYHSSLQNTYGPLAKEVLANAKEAYRLLMAGELELPTIITYDNNDFEELGVPPINGQKGSFEIKFIYKPKSSTAGSANPFEVDRDLMTINLGSPRMKLCMTDGADESVLDTITHELTHLVDRRGNAPGMETPNDNAQANLLVQTHGDNGKQVSELINNIFYYFRPTEMRARLSGGYYSIRDWRDSGTIRFAVMKTHGMPDGQRKMAIANYLLQNQFETGVMAKCISSLRSMQSNGVFNFRLFATALGQKLYGKEPVSTWLLFQTEDSLTGPQGNIGIRVPANIRNEEEYDAALESFIQQLERVLENFKKKAGKLVNDYLQEDYKNILSRYDYELKRDIYKLENDKGA